MLHFVMKPTILTNNDFRSLQLTLIPQRARSYVQGHI